MVGGRNTKLVTTRFNAHTPMNNLDRVKECHAITNLRHTHHHALTHVSQANQHSKAPTHTHTPAQRFAAESLAG